jgi:hypothetical protein
MPYEKFDAISSESWGLTGFEARIAGVYFYGIGEEQSISRSRLHIPSAAGKAGTLCSTIFLCLILQ